VTLIFFYCGYFCIFAKKYLPKMQLLLVFFLKNKISYLLFLSHLKILKQRFVKNLWINLGGYFFLFFRPTVGIWNLAGLIFLRHHTRKKTKLRQLTLVVGLKSVCGENQISQMQNKGTPKLTM
jgi:hypothetical protein